MGWVVPGLAGPLEREAVSSTCVSWEGLMGPAPEVSGLEWAGGCWRLLYLRAPPSQGSPKPQASWTHNGHALDSQRVNVRTGDQDSILFIRSAQRSDSGCYELTVRLEGLEAKAAIDILVIGMGPGEAGLPFSGPRDPHLLPQSRWLMGSGQGV